MNVVKTTCLGNNLLMQIRENTDFPWQKPQQLPSAKANFGGWFFSDFQMIFKKFIKNLYMIKRS